MHFLTSVRLGVELVEEGLERGGAAEVHGLAALLVLCWGCVLEPLADS